MNMDELNDYWQHCYYYFIRQGYGRDEAQIAADDEANAERGNL